MIPESALPDISKLNTLSAMPSYTYKLDPGSKRIVGMTDGLDAVTQMVYKVLYTQRYAWLIYNWDYGMELEQYLGQDMDFVMADIQRSIEEALEQDDRVLGIENFKLRKTGIDSLEVEFFVRSTEGFKAITMEVKL